MLRAQRSGRIIHAAVNHFAVARRHAVADARGLFGDDDIVTGKRGSARDGKAYNAGSDHEDLHRRSLSISRRVPTIAVAARDRIFRSIKVRLRMLKGADQRMA
jgi:hypothetical protein